MSLTLRQGHRLRVFNRKVFVPKRNEIMGDWGKLHEVQAYKRSRGIVPLNLKLSTRLRWVVNFKPQLLYSQGRIPLYPRGWVGPRISLYSLLKRKISLLNFKIKSFMICTPQKILFRQSNHKEWQPGNVACIGERRGAYGVLVAKSDWKRLLGRPRQRWDLKETGLEGMDWIDLGCC